MKKNHAASTSDLGQKSRDEVFEVIEISDIDKTNFIHNADREKKMELLN